MHKEPPTPVAGCSFYPGTSLSADIIFEWLTHNLQAYAEREKYRWKLDAGKYAFLLLREDALERMYETKWDYWVKIDSPFPGEWSVRVRIFETHDYREFDDGVVLDKISLTLDLDDGSRPGMP